MKTVKEISELTGISIRALRYYDEIGLLVPTERTNAGYRLYDDTALEKLRAILFLKELDDAPISFEAFHAEDAEKVTETIVSGRDIDDSAILEISELIKSNVVDGKVGIELLQIYGRWRKIFKCRRGK